MGMYSLLTFEGKPKKTGTFANSEDPDKMLQNAVFHQGLHYLLRQIQISEKEIYYFFGSITCDTSI